MWHFFKKFIENPLSKLGPGLVTGAADDDPSGIVTYSQAGAKFGFNMLWTMLVTFPLMGAVQSICARIGRVTGKGLAANIKQEFSPLVLKSIVFLLLAANILNIAADIAAMGEVAELVTGISRHIATVLFVIVTLSCQILLPYHSYVRFLKFLTLSLLAYVAVAFMINVPWIEVASRTIWPLFEFNSGAATMIIAIFGTTISPYLFFWQASEEVEDMRLHKSPSLNHNSSAAAKEIQRIRWDTWSGMFFSNVVAFFIILATGATLHVQGITEIETAAEAASALRPLGGAFAFWLFGLGILGVGLIAVPVLAGSAGYALAETMGWKWGLERKASDAQGFYGIIGLSVICGLIIQFTPFPPMKALFWSAVINGVVAVPLLVIIIILASRKSVLGKFRPGKAIMALACIATLIMGVAAVRMIIPV